MYTLETAENLEQLKRVVIEPLTRVEGHGKVTLLLDEDNHIQQARLHIVEFRGFEKFIQGRPYWELPVLVQRLCGICRNDIGLNNSLAGFDLPALFLNRNDVKENRAVVLIWPGADALRKIAIPGMHKHTDRSMPLIRRPEHRHPTRPCGMTVAAIEPFRGQVVTIGQIPMMRRTIGKAPTIAISGKNQALFTDIFLLKNVAHQIRPVFILNLYQQTFAQDYSFLFLRALIGNLLLLDDV